MLSQQHLSQLADTNSQFFAPWLNPNIRLVRETSPHSQSITAGRHTFSHPSSIDHRRRSSSNKRKPIFGQSRNKQVNSLTISENNQQYLTPNGVFHPPKTQEQEPANFIQSFKNITEFHQSYQQKKYKKGYGLLNPAELAFMVDNLRKKQRNPLNLHTTYNRIQ